MQPSARSHSGKPGSRPPWNSAVALVITDVHAGARDLERQFRFHLARATPLSRGGSHSNTLSALQALVAMEQIVPEQTAKQAIRTLTRWADRIRQLPAVDDKPRWMKIRAGPDGLPPK